MKFQAESIFNSKNHFLLQIVDCVSIYTKPYGFAYQVEKNYPNTCPYAFRKQKGRGFNVSTYDSRSIPGSVFIIETQNGTKAIINVFAQYCCGRPGNAEEIAFEANVKDGKENREFYFQEALSNLKDYFFGCQEQISIDVSKSSFENVWNTYEKHLQNFENEMIKNGYNLEINVFD